MRGSSKLVTRILTVDLDFSYGEFLGELIVLLHRHPVRTSLRLRPIARDDDRADPSEVAAPKVGMGVHRVVRTARPRPARDERHDQKVVAIERIGEDHIARGRRLYRGGAAVPTRCRPCPQSDRSPRRSAHRSPERSPRQRAPTESRRRRLGCLAADRHAWFSAGIGHRDSGAIDQLHRASAPLPSALAGVLSRLASTLPVRTLLNAQAPPPVSAPPSRLTAF